MKKEAKKIWLVVFVTICCISIVIELSTASAQSASELLGRGLICLPKYPGAYCSWRLLPVDDSNIGFNIYRGTSPTGQFIKVNSAPITTSTNYHDNVAPSVNPYYYKIRTVNGEGLEGDDSNIFKVVVTTGVSRNYTDIPIFDSQTTIHSVVPADFNADGMFGFVIKTPNWDVCHDLNPSLPTKVSVLIFENGTWVTKWTKDFGWKECSGVQDFHNNPLLAWDLDGDLKAEIILRTGQYGENLTVLNGITGDIKATMTWPEHIPLLLGDRDTDGAVIARLRDMNGDGVADPFIVTHSGLYFGFQRFNSVYFDGISLKLIDDLYATKADYRVREGMGSHGYHAADIDLDGKEEIIPCGGAVDDDFSVMWEAYNSKRVNTRHNDVCFISDLRPDLPGLESFMAEEDNAAGMGYAMLVDAHGHILWDVQANPSLDYDGWTDGWCSELTNSHEGTECFAYEKDEQNEIDEVTTVHIFSANGSDITREFFPNPVGNANAIRQAPLDWIKGEGKKELYYHGNSNGIALSGWYHSIFGDVFGDSREEVIGFNKPAATGFFRISSNIDNSSSNYRRVTPLSDRNYRDSLARVGVGYRTNYIAESSGQERADAVYSANPPECTSFNYSVEKCQSSGTQKRNIITMSPSGCVGGDPVLIQPCQYIPPRPANKVDPKGTYVDAENFSGTIPPQGAGTFSVESIENGFLGTGYLKSNGAGANPPTSESKEYLLDFPITGNYNVWVRGFARDSDSNTISYGADGNVVDYFFANTYYDFNRNVWRWLNMRDASTNSNTIIINQPGVHKINVWVNKPNFLIDGIYITDLNQGGKKPTDFVHGKIADPNYTPPEIPKTDINSDGFTNIKDVRICMDIIIGFENNQTFIDKCELLALPDTTTDLDDIKEIIRVITGD